MTLGWFLVWLVADNPPLMNPDGSWSGWLIALVVCAVADFVS